MNEQKGFTIIDFLIQLIFVVLFVMLLVWLFPTKEYLRQNYSNNNIYYEKDSNIADAIFVNNINNMMDASKSYFGYNVALPKEIGEEVKVTLDKLVSEHVMIMPRDSKGNLCSGDSYATITKTTFGYSIKVSLTCGGTTDYIIRSVGCDPFCQNNCNQTCKLEYQYVKKTNGYWTNWTNFSNWSTKKVTANDTTKVETKVVDTKTCPSGYSLNSNKTACVKTVKTEVLSKPEEKLTCAAGYALKDGKCYKTVTTTLNQKADVTLSCDAGYSLNSNKTACVKTTSTSTSIDATKVSKCPSDTVTSGNKCLKITTLASNKKTYYGCNSGYTYIGSNRTCMQVKTLEIGVPNNAKCSITFETDCTNGCKVVQKETCIVNANKWDKYSCEEGYELSTDKKTCTKTEEVNPTISYECKTGKLSGTKCVTTTNTTDTKNVIKTYSCKAGKLVGDTCVIDKNSEEVIEATKTYTCKAGNLKNGTCVITNDKVEKTNYNTVKVTYYRYATKKYVEGSTVYKWSSSREDKNLLNSGYTLTGKTRDNCS